MEKNIIIQCYKNDEWVNVNTYYLRTGTISTTSENETFTLKDAKEITKAYKTIFKRISFRLVKQEFIEIKE